MRKFDYSRLKLRYYVFLIVLSGLIRVMFFGPSAIVDDFDYSTVIYPSPFDKDQTNFFIFLNKKDRLSSNEDQISLSKHHKILDNGHRKINKDENFLLIEYTTIFHREKFCGKTSKEIFGDQCPYKNCFYSCNYSLASQAQLLLFHSYDVTSKTIPSENFTRNSSQIWLLWHDAPNFYYSDELNLYRFNWTMSYVFHAEASIGAYGITIPREKPWSNDEFDKYISHEFSSRHHQAVWFLTKCYSKERLKYFTELKEYFPIQVFGSCVKYNESLPTSNARYLANKLILSTRSNNKTVLSTECDSSSSCEEKQMQSNIYSLAVESESCKDYITEIFWKALKYGVIPIVLGPLSRDHYRRIAPPNSFIYMDDFANAKLLAKHMYETINNEKFFRFYHRWRQYYYIGYTASEIEKYRLCEVCHRLNTMTRRQYYPNVTAFFSQQF